MQIADTSGSKSGNLATFRAIVTVSRAYPRLSRSDKQLLPEHTRATLLNQCIPKNDAARIRLVATRRILSKHDRFATNVKSVGRQAIFGTVR